MSKKVILIITLLLIGCTSDAPIATLTVEQNTSAIRGADSETEEYASYSTVINKLYEGYNPKHVQLMVIRDRTTQEEPSGETFDQRLPWLSEEFGSEIESETLKDFQDKNRQPITLSNHFNIKVQYVLVSPKEIHNLFQKGRLWDPFFERYPKSPGIIALSRVGFNREMNQALVYFAGPSAGGYVLLRQEAGTWSIKREVGAWNE